jgi:hypothetical protein
MHFQSFDPLLQGDSPGQGPPMLNASGRRRNREAGSSDGEVLIDSMGWDTMISGPVMSAAMDTMNGHYGNISVPTSLGTASAMPETHPFQQMPGGEVASFDSPQSHPLHEKHGNFRLEAQQYDQHHLQSYALPQLQQPNQRMLMRPPYLGGGSNAGELPSAALIPPAPHNAFINSALFHSSFTQRQRVVPQQQYATFFQQQFHQQQPYLSAGGGILFSQDATVSTNMSPYRIAGNKRHSSSSQSTMQIQPHHYRQTAHQQKHHAFFAQPQNGFRPYDPMQMRPSIERPLLRLSVALIDVYKNINKVYYEDRAAEMRSKREMHQASAAAQKQQQQRQQRQHSPGQRRGMTQKDQQQSSQWDNEESDYIIREGELFCDRYIIQERIGKGSFGQVIRAHDTVSNRDVAIKIIKSKAPFRIQAQTEIELLMSLREMDADDQHNIGALQHF